jgi:hypothetical protein
MQKSKPQSKQAPICTTLGMKLFFLFSNTIQPFWNHSFEIKTNIDQWSKYTLIQRYNKSEQKSRRKMKVKHSSRKREHSLNDKSKN